MEKPPTVCTALLHAKLLAFDLLSISHHRFSRAETLGVITSRELKPNHFLKFTVDDGTGCIPCILWLNHLSSSYFSNRSNVQLASEFANSSASQVKIGALARVRGRITRYRGVVQITVSDVAIERDPNAEILHWLDCMKLGRTVYGDC